MFALRFCDIGLYRCQPCWKMATIIVKAWGQTCWIIGTGVKLNATKSVEMQCRPEVILKQRITSALFFSPISVPGNGAKP